MKPIEISDEMIAAFIVDAKEILARLEGAQRYQLRTGTDTRTMTSNNLRTARVAASTLAAALELYDPERIEVLPVTRYVCDNTLILED